jgi:hypothetical protein
VQHPGDRRHQAALDHHGEHHHDHHDAVEPARVADGLAEQVAPEQDRHGALEPREHQELLLVAPQARPGEQRADDDGADHEGQHRCQGDPRHPHVRARELAQVDGEPQHHEGDDLTEAGEAGVEVLDLSLVRRPPVADHDPRHEHGQETGPVQECSHPEEGQGARHRPERVETVTGQRNVAHEPEQRPAPEHTDHGTHHHLEGELADDLRERVTRELPCGEEAGHQGNAHRVVRAGLPLEDGAAAPGHLSLAEHGEDHGRVGRRNRGGDQHRGVPRQADHEVQEQRGPDSGEEGARDTDQRDGARGLAGLRPADPHASVEEDEDQGHGDQAVHGLLRRRVQVGKRLQRDRRGRQHQRGGGDAEPLGEPVGQHCRDHDHCGHEQQPREGVGVGHGAPLGEFCVRQSRCRPDFPAHLVRGMLPANPLGLIA